jgi:hypothetical protein
MIYFLLQDKKNSNNMYETPQCKMNLLISTSVFFILGIIYDRPLSLSLKFSVTFSLFSQYLVT